MTGDSTKYTTSVENMDTPGFVEVEQNTRRKSIEWFCRVMIPLPPECKSNKRLVWIVLMASDVPLSRKDLSTATGLAYSSVFGAIEYLDDLGLLNKVEQTDPQSSVLYTADYELRDDWNE